MDAQQTWDDFLDRVQARQTEEAADLAETLLAGLSRLEKAPQVSVFHRLPEIFNRIVVRAACETVLEEAGREYS